MSYKYFISYYYETDTRNGVGRTECERSGKIKKLKDIEEIEEIIQEAIEYKQVIILNWRLFE